MKSIRKYLVNAFTKIGERYDDSAINGEHIRKYGYKNARDYGRSITAMYVGKSEEFGDLPDSIVEMLEEAAMEDRPITQEDFDLWAEEEMSCW